MVEDSIAKFYSEIDEALIWDNQVRMDVLAILEKWEPKILEWLDKYFASALMDGTVERCNRAEERLEAVKKVLQELNEEIDFLKRASRTHGINEVQKYVQENRVGIAEKLTKALEG